MKHHLCHISDIDEQACKEFSLKTRTGTVELFVIRKDGQFFAYKNSCPHTGASLNWQQDQFLDLDNALIQCSIHNALFEIDSGYCVAGPCSGSSLEEFSLKTDNDQLYCQL